MTREDKFESNPVAVAAVLMMIWAVVLLAMFL